MKSEHHARITSATSVAKSFLGTASRVSGLLLLIPAVITAQPADAATFKVLYSFTGGSDGGAPKGDFLLSDNGAFYGTTVAYGPYGYGAIFKVTKGGTGTGLYDFTGGTDGGNPYSSVRMDHAGNLYGTTCCGGGGAGVVWKLDTTGHESALYTFSAGADGAAPYSGLIKPGGEFYGTATAAGAYGAGVVFRLNPRNGRETPIYSFTGGTDGLVPASLTQGPDAFYGVTQWGGNEYCFYNYYNGCGVVFKVTRAGVETTLHTFNGSDGAGPFAGVILDAAGNVYGTTLYGGSYGYGAVFKLDTNNTETVLHSFTGGQDGANPYAALVRDSAGNLYGTTYNGGSSGYGVVFKLDTNNTETVLYSFGNGSDGANPRGALLLNHGNLYGTTTGGGIGGSCNGIGCGVLFEITP